MVMFLEKRKNTIISRKNILKNNKMIIHHVDKLKKNYEFIIVSVISPLLETRKEAKKNFGKNIMKFLLNVVLNFN